MHFERIVDRITPKLSRKVTRTGEAETFKPVRVFGSPINLVATG
jgi:hypothetical protein